MTFIAWLPCGTSFAEDDDCDNVLFDAILFDAVSDIPTLSHQEPIPVSPQQENPEVKVAAKKNEFNTLLAQQNEILNEKLKEEKSKKTIVCFFWIPGNIRSIKPELLENKTYFFDLKDSIDDETDLLKTRILSLLITKGDITKENLFDAEFMQEIKPKVLHLSRKGMPPVATHDLFNEQDDAILNAFRQANLFNKTEDRVKVVFYPIYLTGADGLLDTSYYESMQGAHLGIFPSYYEPWGYTPLEAGALGVSSVTTDLAGFGRYLCTECVPEKNPGIFVLKRFGRAYDETVQDLASIMYYFANLPVQERVANKMTAQKVAATADWKLFIERYIEAHNLAISKL